MNQIHTTQVNLSTNIINFGIGQPGFDLLPLDIMRRAAEIRMSSSDTSLLNYGYELGDGYFRLALASFLEPHYNLPVSADSLMVTCGASQALDLICTLFTKPGDLVYAAEPTYFLALRIFEDHGLEVNGLPTDEKGLIIADLEAALEDRRPTLLYTVPTFQNPTGATLPHERRQKLVALAQEYNFLIAADEVYHLLHYDQPPPLPLAAYIESEKVFSIGSFSKILGPGLRLGWVQAAPALLNKLAGSGLLDSGGGLNPFTSNLVRVVLEEGWQDAYLANLKTTYQRRAAVMADALKRHLGGTAQFTMPSGGFFFWLTLTPGVDTTALLPAAHEKLVGFQPGIKFSSSNSQQNKMRLSFAFYNEDEIERGIVRLGRVINDSV